MSNRAVSTTYRTIIDDVIANVRQDFEDMGIEKEVLEELQRSWEAKIVATGVADFEGAEPVAPRSRKESRAQSNGASQSTSNGGGGESSQSMIKTEDGINPASLGGGSSSNKVSRTNGSSDVKGGGAEVNGKGNGATSTSSSQNSSGGGGGGGAMPIEGLLSSNGDHASANKRKRPAGDENEIGSDLDDSDEEELDGLIDAEGNEDMILCLYDKVQRVRNKWKCVLKDGVASIDGRDYVFSKLASELEW